MDSQLKSLLVKTIAEGQKGIFHLGKGEECRKISFDGTHLELIPGQSLRWFPTTEILCEKLSSSTLDGLLKIWHGGERDLSQWFNTLKEIDASLLTKVHEEIQKRELVLTFLHCEEVFLFEGSKEAECGRKTKISAENLIEKIDQKTFQHKEALETFPSQHELPVLSASGTKGANEVKDWCLQKVTDLLDGFRTIKEILEDSPLPPYETMEQLNKGVQRGWILKQRFPEFSDQHIRSMNDEDRSTMIVRLEKATQMAVNPVKILEILRDTHIHSGDQAKALSVENRIVDALKNSRHLEQAIDLLEQMIQKDPENDEWIESKIALMSELAHHLISQGDVEFGRRWLRDAIEQSDDDQMRLDLIATHSEPQQQMREGVRMATRLFRSGDRRRALRLIDSLEALHPDCTEMQQAKVEFLIDHGEIEATEEALTRLAARLAKEGRLQRAKKVAKSVAKLRTEHKEKKPGLLFSLGIRWQRLFLIIIFFSFIGLLIVTESRLQKLIVSADSSSPEAWREEARPWLLLIPAGPWKSGLESAAQLIEERESDRARSFRNQAEDLLKLARKNRSLGQQRKAKENLQQAARLGAREEVRKLLSQWDQEDIEANALRKKVDQCRSKGDLKACRQYLSTLLERYPSNDATVGVQFPVRINSSENTVMLIDGIQHALPVILEIPPFKTQKVVLERNARQAVYVITAEGPAELQLPAP